MNENSAHTINPGQSAAKVAIVTDSIAQVPPELVRELGIQIMPFSLTVEGKIYTDLMDLDINELYQRMRVEKDLRLLTSAPSMGHYYQTFKSCRDRGAESVLYIGISSRLSGAFNTAQEAVRLLREDLGPQPIYLYDSRLATSAQGFLAVEAARLADSGADTQTIIDHIVEERKRTGFAAGLETLEYLARGGRIGRAAYMLGNAINILPVVSLDENGEVAPISRIRGYKRVMKEIIRYVKENISGYQSLSLAVMHADALPYAEELQAMAIKQFLPDEIYITYFTPTMVAHTGPGIIGLAYHWHP